MPLQWNPILNDLIDLLRDLYPEQRRARLVVRRAGMNPHTIDFSGTPSEFWMMIVEEANKHATIPALINVAKEDYPNISFEQPTESPPSSQPAAQKIEDIAWKGPTNNLERITGAQSTFLPISFLEAGVRRAQSIARINSPRGIGTGFLINKNLLITNNHVISNPADARASRIWFNYQKTITGADAELKEYMLDPDTCFATSSADFGDDWTAVYVKGNPNETWGALELADVSVQVDDFVNIIQHPGGMPKQIAMYHNVVVFRSDTRVQYLTDTMPGSSGSPVFDSHWRVVALHHSGGSIIEPGTNKIFFRNEGVHVSVLIKGLSENGLLFF